MATTPPLRDTSISQPPTPLYGGRYDNLRHRPTRTVTHKSTSRRIREIGTPPPNTKHQSNKPVSSLRKKVSARPADTLSPPLSTHTSPRKKVTKGRISTGAIHREAADPVLHHQYNHLNQPHLNQATDHNAPSMLPTPAKTPAKKPVAAAAINGAARVLFPVRPDTVEEAMPKPRKHRQNRRHAGLSLYSSTEEEGASQENHIQIFTDSKDKVPELDLTEDNPFLEQPLQAPPPPEPSKGRSNRKRKASQAIDGNPEIKEALNRDDGMVYVFRGKKIFRKFPDEGSDQDDDSVVDMNDPETCNLRPLNRSSIKPRLLFPTPHQRAKRSASAIEDEEAPTDVDDTSMPNTEKEQPVTPVKTIFSPATPPTTGHATRSSTKKARLGSSSPTDLLEADLDPTVEPAQSGRNAKKLSPFDGWARTKAGGSGGKGTKREADTLEKDDGVHQHKRSKGDMAV